MRHRVDFSAEYPDERTARTTERSVAREAGEIDGDRSRTRIDREGATLSVVVEAADLVALRAASNTWLSLVSTAERAIEAGEEALSSRAE